MYKCAKEHRRVRVTAVAIKKQYVLHILSVYVCSRSYHAPYYIDVCGLSGFTVLSRVIS
jgi:hypothetical protein